MKTTFVLLAAAGAAMAQDLATLPQCGQTCVNNMINIAQTQFGCGSGDASCFCGNADFGYGIRDCASQACPSQEDAAQVISYGTSYCEQALQSAQPSASSAAASTGAVGILTSALATATQTTGTAMETTMATSASGAMESASSAMESASEAASSIASSISEVASSASASASSVASSAASRASSIASSASEAASSAVSSATSDGAAQPMKTAFPMAGAVGIAAMLLI